MAALDHIERYGAPAEDFARAVQASVERYGCRPEDLQLEDLALAAACAAGSEAAWQEFHARYRRFLVDLAGDCDTADEIIAELYQGQIAAYRGRSSLQGWLRAIAYQAKVDRHRRESRLVQLDVLSVEPSRTEHPEHFERRDNAATLARALRAAVDELPAERRLLLVWYYADRLRLAQIARLRGVHESTVSRELDSIRTSLRRAVEKRLRAQGFSRARIEECFRHATDAPFELAGQETPAGPY